jgi:hypothetical protein
MLLRKAAKAKKKKKKRFDRETVYPYGSRQAIQPIVPGSGSGSGSHQQLTEHARQLGPPPPGPGRGSERLPGRMIFVQVRTSGPRIESAADRTRQSTQPPVPGSGSGFGSRVRARDFRSGSQIGATDRIRDTSLAPICERQPAGGPSSGRPRSGWWSWTKRSVLTRDPGPDPDPKKARCLSTPGFSILGIPS